jgi:hypothetical protein
MWSLMVPTLNAGHITPPTAADPATVSDIRLIPVDDQAPNPFMAMGAVALGTCPTIAVRSQSVALPDIG